MKLFADPYIPGETPIHMLDARVKIILMILYSIALVVLRSWWGMALCLAVFIVVLVLSKVSLKRLFSLLIFMYVIAGFSLGYNMATAETVALGFAEGLFVALRMLLLVAGSLLLCFTTESNRLLEAFSWLIGPLRAFKVPVDDVASTLAIALRFIPTTGRELANIYRAQACRGCHFSDGSLLDRVRAWAGLFVPAFVQLFRRADCLASAMDARCYGAASKRTSLSTLRMGVRDKVVFVFGATIFALLIVLL